jgi:hypothetical protein
MDSQYTISYLEENKSRGWGKGITPGTYIVYKVRGAAKEWSGRYTRSLINCLEKRVNNGEAISGPSRCKSTAYYPIE